MLQLESFSLKSLFIFTTSSYLRYGCRANLDTVLMKALPLKVLNKCQTLVNIAPCPPLAKLEPQSSNIPELLSPSKFEQSDRFALKLCSIT